MNIPSLLRYLVFFLVLDLLAGCRSERVAFDFTTRQPTAFEAARAKSVMLATTENFTAREQSASLRSNLTTPEQPEPKHRLLKKRTISAVLSLPIFGASSKRLNPLALRWATPWQAPAAATQARPAVSDQGLGKIFFLLLAAVVAVLAGLAFAVAAIFSIGFWLALGYVAGGIVVLLLLRALIKKLGRK